MKIKRERFKEAMAYSKHTIKELGNKKIAGRSEKTIGRYLKSEEMPYEVLDKIAEYIDVNPDFITGKFDASEDLEIKTRRRMQSFVKPQKFPYAMKNLNKATVDQYYSSVFRIHDISMKHFISMTPEIRFQLQYDIEDALISVLKEYFGKESEGRLNVDCLKSQIELVEADYERFGLDYWTEPDYAHKVNDKEAEDMKNWLP